MRLSITDHGDPSVGLFQRTWWVDCPFDSSASSEEREWFRAELSKIYSEFADGKLSLVYEDENVSGMLPINDVQIRCYVLLQLIAKAEMVEPSPYSPENDIRRRNIANWKQEYYTLIGNTLL